MAQQMGTENCAAATTASPEAASHVTDCDCGDNQLIQMAKEHGAHLLHVPDMTDISSSKVRACRDVNVLQSLVTPEVLAYMQEHRLYKAFATKSNIESYTSERGATESEAHE
jgi:nicotinic acid mononucleotide adenylyltransferase